MGVNEKAAADIRRLRRREAYIEIGVRGYFLITFLPFWITMPL